jgi:endonuclease G
MPPVFRFDIATLFLAVATASQASINFSECLRFFVNARPPVLAQRSTDRALFYDAFAVLHSGESKTPVFVTEKLNRKSIASAHEKRTDKFFVDARLRAAERANLEDYKGKNADALHCSL